MAGYAKVGEATTKLAGTLPLKEFLVRRYGQVGGINYSFYLMCHKFVNKSYLLHLAFLM